MGRTALAELIDVPSIVHLKLKYYTDKGHVATLHGDIEAARRCFEASAKGQASIETIPKPVGKRARDEEPASEEHQPDAKKPACQVNSVDLDSRLYEEHDDNSKSITSPTNSSLASALMRPVPDGEFEVIAFGNNLNRG